MMKRYLTLLASAVLLASCSVVELDGPEVNDNDIVFFARFDEEPDTKTYLNEEGLMRWTADDRLTIFAGKTYNQQYAFDGETGAKDGSFSKVGNPDFVSGSPLPNNVAVYPYSSATAIDDDGAIHVSLPETQAYAENSFGLNANTMVAATDNKDDNTLFFKNACGYLRVSLYGDALIKSITLTGNDGEKIAGAATVVAANGQVPSLTMADSATDVITIDCGDGVQLGTTAATATTFLFVVPETAFGKGITIKATSDNGAAFLKTTGKPVTVSRNKISKMAALEFEVNIVNIPDPDFKAYCVANFDTNRDGEISFEEARVVETINCSGTSSSRGNIKSLEGIECFTALTYLYCDFNQLISLDVSKNVTLTQLSCASNKLTSLDVSNNTALTLLTCYSNQLTNLNVSNDTALTYLHCQHNQLASLDVSSNTALITLDCYYNQLTCLDVINNTALTTIFCEHNQLNSLDVSNNTALINLDCEHNQLTSLDVSENVALTSLMCYDNPYLTEIWLFKEQYIEYFGYDKYVATIKYKGVDDVVKFSDPAFKNYCVTRFDTNGDGEISFVEAKAVKSIICGGTSIKSLEGIEYFTELTKLSCDSNQLTSLDVSSNTALTSLNCASNQLTYLDVSSNTALTDLRCFSNQLTSLDVSMSTGLTYLSCNHNQLTSLNVSGCRLLKNLICSGNRLTNIDVSNNTALSSLNCSTNLLTSLDVSKNTAVTTLYCAANKLSSLDLGTNTALTDLSCFSNQFTSLDVSNNMALTRITCYSNPYLTEIWLKTGQSISTFSYDTDVATIKYKD